MAAPKGTIVISRGGLCEGVTIPFLFYLQFPIYYVITNFHLACLLISNSCPCSLQLMRPTKRFNIDDPHHYETVIAPPYESLHDPTAKLFLGQPHVIKTLLYQKLVNERGQVICNLKAFNDYRQYLARTVYNEDVNIAIQNENALEENQRAQMKALRDEIYRTSGQGFKFNQRAARARQFQEDMIRFNAET